MIIVEDESTIISSLSWDSSLYLRGPEVRPESIDVSWSTDQVIVVDIVVLGRGWRQGNIGIRV